jgi:hypothetical protein
MTCKTTVIKQLFRITVDKPLLRYTEKFSATRQNSCIDIKIAPAACCLSLSSEGSLICWTDGGRQWLQKEPNLWIIMNDILGEAADLFVALI